MSRKASFPALAFSAVTLGAALLPGCVTWLDEAPTCSFEVAPWSDDLLAHIMSGDGSGSFDYDPEDAPRNTVAGAYNVNTGDYSWSIAYANTYFLVDGSVEGYGTAYHNGDLDILQTTVETDVLGAQFLTNERTRREGCQMTSEYWSEDDESDLFATFGTYTSATSFEWTADVSGYTVQGSMHENLSRTETYEADDGSYYTQITTKPEGVAEGDIAYTSGAYDFAGTYKRRFDGGEEYTLAQTEDGETVANIVDDFNYDGSGTETQTYPDGSRCTFTIEANSSCTYACSDGSSGSC